VYALRLAKDKHAWSNRQKASFAELKRRNLKTHRGFFSVLRPVGASHHDLSQVPMTRYPHQTQESR